MSEEERHNYYEGMANSVLWPVSHYLLRHLALERAFIEDYRRINRRFADAVLEEAGPNDTIWVQAQIYEQDLPYIRLGQEARL